MSRTNFIATSFISRKYSSGLTIKLAPLRHRDRQPDNVKAHLLSNRYNIRIVKIRLVYIYTQPVSAITGMIVLKAVKVSKHFTNAFSPMSQGNCSLRAYGIFIFQYFAGRQSSSTAFV